MFSTLLNWELMNPAKTMYLYSPGYHPGVVRGSLGSSRVVRGCPGLVQGVSSLSMSTPGSLGLIRGYTGGRPAQSVVIRACSKWVHHGLPIYM